MSRSMSSMNAFLANAKSALRSSKIPITIVTGNQSADIDSLSCSLLYAYFQSSADPSRRCIPLTNIPSEELRLRPEFTWLLGQANLKPEELLTLDDIPSDVMDEAEWALVDHNVLTGALEKLQYKSVGVIDHHQDEKAVPEDAVPRIIETCGSCASLVVNHFKGLWKSELDNSPSGNSLSNTLATMAAGAILIDTTNLTRKMSTHDSDAFEFIKTRWPQAHAQAGFFKALSDAKSDLSVLSCSEVFKKDYKSWSTKPGMLGISSSVKNIDWLIQKAGSDTALQKSIAEFATTNDLTIWALMTTSNDEKGNFRRELIVWTKDEAAQHALEKFVEVGREELELEDWKEVAFNSEGNGKPWSHAWFQNSLEKSRKQVGPLLRRTLNGEA